MRRTNVRHVKMPGMYVRYAGRPPAPDELQATHIMKDTSEPGFCVTDGGGGRSGHYILTRSRLWIKKVTLGHFVDRILWGRTFVHKGW